MKYVSKKDVVIPHRKKTAKKGDAGKLLIVGGSEQYVGAVALAGIAAMRSGVDWVTVAAPEKVAWAVNAYSPDLVTIKLKGKHLKKAHSKKIINESKKYSTILIGNGTELHNETIQCIKILNEAIDIPKIIDADGIKALSLQELTNTILTPHNKELEIILKSSFISMKLIRSIAQEKNIEKKAKLIQKSIQESNILHENGKSFFENNNVILLKGKIDAIITAKKIVYNKTGNPGMAKAGTGDVLAGLAAGFVAQGLSLEQSTVNAAYFNGLAGDILMKKKKGFTYLASDLVDEMESVVKLR